MSDSTDKLKPGDIAPNFHSKNQHGGEISLHKFQGRKVILYFYPKDDTPGCTAESCNLRDNYEDLRNKGYEVIGVSADDVNSHKHFADKFNLPFDLVADVDKEILHAYGVYGEKNMYGKVTMGIHRKTFLIDEQGHIEKIFGKVDTANHTQQILDFSI